MSSGYYVPGENRAASVNEMFARIARRYDRLNDLQSLGWHRRWKRRVVQLARVTPGVPALDVCCGTGDLALALARRGAQVTGLDFSPPMLAVAAARAQASRGQSGTPLPQFQQGDAQQLPYADNTFDIVTMGYGLRNLADWPRGVEEMARVARPGARILTLDFGQPANAVWRKAYFWHLRLTVPLIGRLFGGNAAAYAYILESLQHYPGQRAVAEKMRALKLENVRVINLLGGAMAINYAEKG